MVRVAQLEADLARLRAKLRATPPWQSAAIERRAFIIWAELEVAKVYMARGAEPPPFSALTIEEAEAALSAARLA